MDFVSAGKALLRKTRTLEAAKNLYCALGGTVYRSEGEWLRLVLGDQSHVFFIQIGAHDGKTSDNVYPIARERGWRGILVEPVPYLFDRLVDNYRGLPGIICENVALAEEPGKRCFHRLGATADPLPLWYDQLGSLSRQTILSHRSAIPNIEEYLIEEEVECITFDTLVVRHQVKEVDLILVDTEGSDLKILQTIDLRRFRPKLIIYEQKHLSLGDRARAQSLLTSRGYAVHPTGVNNAAVLRRSR